MRTVPLAPTLDYTLLEEENLLTAAIVLRASGTCACAGDCSRGHGRGAVGAGGAPVSVTRFCVHLKYSHCSEY